MMNNININFSCETIFSNILHFINEYLIRYCNFPGSRDADHLPDININKCAKEEMNMHTLLYIISLVNPFTDSLPSREDSYLRFSGVRFCGVPVELMFHYSL